MQNDNVMALLDSLEQAMREAGLWAEQSPSQVALSSKMPFCCDTLSFEDWLQFVFIPKMTTLIEQALPLPENLVISPMAEESWGLGSSQCKAGIRMVYKVLKEIDERFAGEAQ